MSACLYAAVALLSASSLALEIVLIRLFSVMQGHDYASMVISLALLGIGAGGIAVRLFRSWLLARAPSILTCLCLLFGASAIGSFAAARELQFNPLEVMWSGGQWLALAGTYAVLAVPFACFGAAISLAMSAETVRIRRIYAADLSGAGIGALLAMVSLSRCFPGDCLQLVASGGVLASAFFAGRQRWRKGAVPLLLAGALALPFLLPASATVPSTSEYKPLAQAKRRPGSKVLLEKPSPHGIITVVASPRMPFRYAPGLSPLCPVESPKQRLVFLNGQRYGALPATNATDLPAEFLDCLPTQIAYTLLEKPSVLLSGGLKGLGAFEALSRSTDSVHILDKNWELLTILSEAASLANQAKESVHCSAESVRAFLSRRGGHFDLLQLWSPCAGEAPLGSQGVNEDFTCTVQGLEQMYAAVAPGGLILLSRWLDHPPAASLKLLGTAVEALERSGVKQPGKSLAVIASPTTISLLISKGGFNQADLERIETFCSKRAFGAFSLSGRQGDASQSRPELSRGVQALLSKERERFQLTYPFCITPATDDSPYFSRFFRWSSLPELMRRHGSGGASLIQWGYLILIAMAVQAALAGILLILLPLAVFRRGQRTWKSSGRAALAFTCLGLGFLFLEIAFIQRLILLLGDPVAAVSVALGSFLVFAGLGSMACGRLGLGRAVLCLCLTVLLLFLGLDLLGPTLMAQAWGLKVGLAVAMCAVPAFFMGMPLPLGLETVSRQAPEWIPWAWGVNGFASVLAPILATLLSIHLGLASVVGGACLLYLGAYLALRSMSSA